MTTTRTTARVEIYDAAVENGYDVEVEEGVTMWRFRSDTANTVTRMVIIRKPEFPIAHGVEYLTIVFSETDAFVRGWITYGRVDRTPWVGKQSGVRNKTEILKLLAQNNPERLATFNAKREVERREAQAQRLAAAEQALADHRVKVADNSRTAIDMIRLVLTDEGITVKDGAVDRIFVYLSESQVFRQVHQGHDEMARLEAALRVAQDDAQRHGLEV